MSKRNLDTPTRCPKCDAQVHSVQPEGHFEKRVLVDAVNRRQVWIARPIPAKGLILGTRLPKQLQGHTMAGLLEHRCGGGE